MSERIYSETFEPGSIIVKIGDPGDYAYIVQNGKVEVSVPFQNSKKVLAELGQGEIFGEMAIIDSSPRSATVTAIETTEVIVIELSKHMKTLAYNNPIMDLVLRVVLSRLRKTSEQVTGRLAPNLQEDDALKKIQSEAIKKIKYEKQMREGLALGEFEVHYQPIISLARREISGFEALLRWKNKKRMVPPNEFIPFAEETGLIIEQGQFALINAMSDHRQFCSLAKNEELFMSVNLSGKQVSSNQEVETIKNIINSGEIKPQQLKLEVTETFMLDNFVQGKKVLNNLKNIGATIAIDDFGTGYSSLSYLHELPLDTLKIDRAFINNIEEDKRSFQIVETIMSLSNTLDIDVVAEGIETEKQMSILTNLGCDFCQGFHISKPLTSTQTLDFIKNYN